MRSRFDVALQPHAQGRACLHFDPPVPSFRVGPAAKRQQARAAPSACPENTSGGKREIRQRLPMIAPALGNPPIARAPWRKQARLLLESCCAHHGSTGAARPAPAHLHTRQKVRRAALFFDAGRDARRLLPPSALPVLKSRGVRRLLAKLRPTRAADIIRHRPTSLKEKAKITAGAAASLVIVAWLLLLLVAFLSARCAG